MRVAVICKSDQTGGAAVTSRRLTEALNAHGFNARMIVVEKKSGSPFVRQAPWPHRQKWAFLKERLHIYIADGFSKANLFKIDTGEEGLPLWRLPEVRDAEAVILNWVNQGMLSLKGVERLVREGKKVIWTMHDMWNFTGICHHAMGCDHFKRECGNCFLLGRKASPGDLSLRIWQRKRELYDLDGIQFVAVSRWLLDLAKQSSLLGSRKIHHIPNAFPLDETADMEDLKKTPRDRRILFVAARLDDPIKGIGTLREAIRIFNSRYPEEAADTSLHLVGGVKDTRELEGFDVRTEWHGSVDDGDRMRRLYASSAAVVSTSHFENLPGTLIEGQAYGAVPVAFNRGGQPDIVDHLSTGYLAPWIDDLSMRAANIADGLHWALAQGEEIREKMRKSVIDKFSYDKIAGEYARILKTDLN